MREGWFWIIAITVFLSLTVGGIVLHEYLETPQDKCIDACSYGNTDFTACMQLCMYPEPTLLTENPSGVNNGK